MLRMSNEYGYEIADTLLYHEYCLKSMIGCRTTQKYDIITNYLRMYNIFSSDVKTWY
jgi:hypothetical protein